MQWNVTIGELIPQVLRSPEMPETTKARATATKPSPRLEDFPDEPTPPLPPR
jgi:hypothetical protein